MHGLNFFYDLVDVLFISCHCVSINVKVSFDIFNIQVFIFKIINLAKLVFIFTWSIFIVVLSLIIARRLVYFAVEG